MPAISSSAPGKVILCGEHAVVYGQPAIALPVQQVRTKTTILAQPIAPTGEVRLIAPVIGLNTTLDALDERHPLHTTITLVCEEIGIRSMPACEIRIISNIPVAAGMGSSASVTVSLSRALTQFLGHPLQDDAINRIAFEVEKIHHGTPSGIDNSVITYEAPVYFRKGETMQKLKIRHGFSLVIADSGTPGSTAKTVAAVREKWQREPNKYATLFGAIGEIVEQVHEILLSGELVHDAALLTQNHHLLQELGVSTPKLDDLVNSALKAGAAGAKLSGGGGGGNIIAVTSAEKIDLVTEAVKSAGAVEVIVTHIPGENGGVQ
jgi:mevalonate kinase